MRYFPRGFVAAAALAVVLGLPASADAGTQYQYDALGRLVRVTHETGVVVQYSYDSAGNRAQVITGSTVANLAPVTSNDAMRIPLSHSVDVWVLANDRDPDGDPLTVTSVNAVTGGGSAYVAGSGGWVRFTAPTASGAGIKTFTYVVSDGRGGSSSATATMDVYAPNRVPVAVNDSASVNASTAIDVMVRGNDSDADGDVLTVTSVGAVSGGGTATIQGGGTHIRYTAPSTGGVKTFTYTISDGRGGTASATVSVNVIAANRPPVAVNDAAYADILTAISIPVLANDSDPDGQALTITSVTTPTKGSASIASGGASITYNAPSTAGTYSFQYTVSDGAGGAATATVSVVVQRVIEDPDCLMAAGENIMPPPGCL